MISQKIGFPLPWQEPATSSAEAGIKERGNNLAKFLGSSPSPQPSPVEGKGVFLSFYDFIKFGN
jgi:hypothetical protein